MARAARWHPNGAIRAKRTLPPPVFKSQLGWLFNADCLRILPQLANDSIDLIFADPPFNLGKQYGAGIDDTRSAPEYLAWCKRWISESARILKPGGSFFLYSLPKWNLPLGAYLIEIGLTFRHWIAIDVKLGLPIKGRLYPSHYSLLYFTKGKPSTFHPVRLPIRRCRHCSGDIKDYGGHRSALNPQGVNLTDVWDDIPPVRHSKFKSRRRKANQLSTKLLKRVISLSTNTGDLVLDPFGGAGTTFDVCEQLRRHWIGIELASCSAIIERLAGGLICHHHTDDYVDA
jgi:site-specific DNA-methyltransferase (adenine-specific)